MTATKYSLSDFHAGCNGRWQNAIHIPCGNCSQPCPMEQRGCLMAAHLSGEPIVISVSRYQKLTGHKVQPKSCAAALDLDAFASAYYRYLLWELDCAVQCPLRRLDEKVSDRP